VILSIDCETSNLPTREMAVTDKQYPWPVRIGAALFDDNGRDQAIFSTGIRADGRSIAPDAQNVHGISTRQANKSGIPELVALSVICHLASEASLLVGFNVEFDRDILVAAIIRHDQDPRRLLRPGLRLVDLMKPCAPFCKLPTDHDSGSYRWPSLDDASRILLGEEERTGPHTDWDDLQRAKRLFFWLRDRGALDIAA
jgi:DNA polymerase III epsilon subunit-like protein